VLATGGGLVFQGTGTGPFRVFDKATGRLLKQIDVQSTIMAAPMTYSVKGVQYVAVMAAWGGGGWAIGHPESAAARYGNEGRIIAFRLDGAPPRKLEPLPPPGPVPEPPAQAGSPAEIAAGERLFNLNCRVCHTGTAGSAVPDLRRMDVNAHAAFDDIVMRGALLAGGMPRWDDVLSPADAKAIHAYVISIARQMYDEDAGERAAARPDPTRLRAN
jgi:quinohemoprotein ethanol dehydrogenase